MIGCYTEVNSWQPITISEHLWLPRTKYLFSRLLHNIWREGSSAARAPLPVHRAVLRAACHWRNQGSGPYAEGCAAAACHGRSQGSPPCAKGSAAGCMSWAQPGVPSLCTGRCCGLHVMYHNLFLQTPAASFN